jgi:hypothetical protein
VTLPALRWLRVFTQFPPVRSWPRSLAHHAPADIVNYTPSVIRPSWRQKSAPRNGRCCGVASVQTRQYVLNRRGGFLAIRFELMGSMSMPDPQQIGRTGSRNRMTQRP